MVENKTHATQTPVDDYIAGLESARRQEEATMLRAMFERVTAAPATMWGPSIIGFGRYRYTYESGHSGEAPMIGFSPRKTALSFYLIKGYPMHETLLARLGKHNGAKGCLYVNKLADVDLAVLEQMIAKSWEERCRRHPVDEPMDG